jgi:PAS domain S-box-containing protein
MKFSYLKSRNVRKDHLALLLEISNTLASEHETCILLQKITDFSVKLLNLGSATIYLMYEDTLRLETTHPPFPPDSPEERRIVFLKDHPYINQAITSLEPVILLDTRAAELTPAEKAVIEVRKLRSLLYLPLVYKDRLLGMLTVGSVETLHEFSAYEMEVCRALANQAALWIEETRLFEANQRAVRELEKEIGDHRENLHALQKREEHYRRLAENAQDLIYRFRLHQPRGYEYISPAATAFTGYAPEDYYVDPDLIFKLTHPDDRHILESLINGRADITKPVTLRWVRKDGEVIWTEQRNVPVYDEGGNLVALEGIARDITAQKKAELELEAYSNKLEEMVTERTRELERAQQELVIKEKMATLGQLAGSVGHELRNPLGVINNAAYILDSAISKENLKARKYTRMIASQVQRSNKIISDLLNFAGNPVAEKTNVAIPGLIEQVLRNLAPPEDVQVETRIKSRLPLVLADPLHIEQVLINLISNAYQAMPEGGSLLVEATVKKGEVHISIKDNGTGITPHDMPKLFTPLFTTKVHGIGLGLATSKKLAEANGGRIEVSSKPGEGSIFTLALPAL